VTASVDEHTSLAIGRATTELLPAVCRIAEHWQLGRVSPTDKANGFLLAGWKLRDYQRFLDIAEHFYLARHGGQVTGFIIAYHQGHDELDPVLNRELAKTMTAYLNIEQICVHPRWVRRGVASCLWRHLFARCAPVPVVVEIVSSPPNTPSANLHRKLGFEPFLDLARSSGVRTTVWRRPRPPA
jgi:ribosomal protein S18 acetylase RimI-like enzyme